MILVQWLGALSGSWNVILFGFWRSRKIMACSKAQACRSFMLVSLVRYELGFPYVIGLMALVQNKEILFPSFHR